MGVAIKTPPVKWKAQKEATQEQHDENAISTTTEESVVSEDYETIESSDKDKIKAFGEMDIDKGLFDVTITMPAELMKDVTQEKLDKSVSEGKIKSATLNDDGSVTYVMSKAQQKEMLDGIRESTRKTLNEMVGSEDYPNITAIETNDDFTKFTVTTRNEKPDFSESFSVLAFYMYGAMYNKIAGNEVDNIHVDFVNADTGEIISSSNSKDLGKDSGE